MLDYPLPTWTVYPLMKELCLPKLTLPALLICYIVCLPPALTFSLNTVYDSVLPTWYLTPVIDICLSDLPCELIKLQMDPNDTASSLHLACITTFFVFKESIIGIPHSDLQIMKRKINKIKTWTELRILIIYFILQFKFAFKLFITSINTNDSNRNIKRIC